MVILVPRRINWMSYLSYLESLTRTPSLVSENAQSMSVVSQDHCCLNTTLGNCLYIQPIRKERKAIMHIFSSIFRSFVYAASVAMKTAPG